VHAIDTPERRAAFEERLEKLLGEIGNARVKDHYRREVKNRLFNLWREKRTGRGRVPANAGAPQGRSGSTPLPSSYGFVTTITLALVNHPWLLDRFADEVASLDIKDKKLAALLQSVTGIIFEDTHVTRERLAERLEAGSHGKVFAALSRDSAFKRVAFLQPESPEKEVAEQFADLIYRFRALPSLTRELQEGADHLADVTEAEFERFAMLQQQVASVGSRHDADDAGDRDAQKRFRETVARLKGENIGGQRGRRYEPPS
jgi:DNA primase